MWVFGYIVGPDYLQHMPPPEWYCVELRHRPKPPQSHNSDEVKNIIISSKPTRANERPKGLPVDDPGLRERDLLRMGLLHLYVALAFSSPTEQDGPPPEERGKTVRCFFYKVKGTFGRVCRYRCIPGVFLVGVPNLPKCRVPILRSYRTYRSGSVRPHYPTEPYRILRLGIEAVPNIPARIGTVLWPYRTTSVG